PVLLAGIGVNVDRRHLPPADDRAGVAVLRAVESRRGLAVEALASHMNLVVTARSRHRLHPPDHCREPS
ncbi:MAG: hypothetical protein ACO3WU_03620, partial [Ilumatobacteraceae bacterium]